MLDAVAVNVVVGTDRLLELRADDHTRSFGRGSTSKEHDATSGVGEGGLKQRSGNAKSNTSATKRPLPLRYRPWVALEVLKDAGELEFALCNGHEELGSSRSRHLLSLQWLHGAVGGVETEHVRNLLGLVVLGAAEDVRLGAWQVG